MKQRFKDNSGFSLIELIIAMAILAIMMTAIGSIMGSSVMGHRKSKAEIQIHTSAQETYNQVSDTIMQAKDVVIVCASPTDAVAATYDFSEPGKLYADNITAGDERYYVKDADMKKFIIDNPGIYGTFGANNSNVYSFSTLDVNDTLYVKKLIIRTSEVIDPTDAPDIVEAQTTQRVKDNLGFATASDASVDLTKVKEVAGEPVYNINDNVIHTYTFEGSNMYYEKKYSFMTDRDDKMVTTSEETKAKNLYNSGFSYITTGSAKDVEISACMLNVDAPKGAIGINFQFNDKNMTYTTNGMVNIRNSYILKAREK